MISRSNIGPYAGIIQIRWYGSFSAFVKKGTPSHLNQLVAINISLMAARNNASRMHDKQAHTLSGQHYATDDLSVISPLSFTLFR